MNGRKVRTSLTTDMNDERVPDVGVPDDENAAVPDVQICVTNKINMILVREVQTIRARTKREVASDMQEERVRRAPARNLI